MESLQFLWQGEFIQSRDNLKISYPVYDKNRIIGVLVFQIDIINDLKNISILKMLLLCTLLEQF